MEDEDRKKVFPLVSSPAEARRYEAEIVLLQRIGVAPGLPLYRYDGFTPQGERFVVYREVAGQSLREYLNNHERPAPCSRPDEGWLRFVRSLLVCVCFLHERRAPIFHGDISANNVIVSPEGLAGLTDFGVSRSRGLPFPLRFPSRQSIAAPRYMSPEQARGGYWGSASDIFQVGLVGLELMLGEPVNMGLSVEEILVRLRQRQDFAQQLAGQVPGFSGSILSRLLDPDPARRPRAGEALARLYPKSP